MNDFEKYKQLYGDLYEKELLLESEAKQEAEEHLKDALEKAKREGEGGAALGPVAGGGEQDGAVGTGVHILIGGRWHVGLLTCVFRTARGSRGCSRC